MSNKLENVSDTVKDTIKNIPEVYSDGLKLTVHESGKCISLIPKTINAALAPLRQWIMQREYNVSETEKLLAQKLEQVGEEKIVSPEPYVAIPAIQAISYSMNSAELRNLYANLLAKSMCTDTKDLVHPAYVDIIKQMTPLDAQILRTLAETPDKDMAIIDLLATTTDNTSYITLLENVTSLSIASIEAISLSIANLRRHNLISITTETYTGREAYDAIYSSEQYLAFIQKPFPPKYPNSLSVEKAIMMSIFGKSFYNICVSEDF